MRSVHTSENACDGIGQVEGLNLRRLFQNRVIVVPINQRPFAWEMKELSELWEDINSLEGRGYFMSSIVIKPCTIQSNSDHEYQEPSSQSMYMTRSAGIFKPHTLIDGQQRLISLSILIRCVCEYLDDRKTVEKIREEYLFFEPINSSDDARCNETTRMKLHKDLDEVFASLLSFRKSENPIFGTSDLECRLSFAAQERLISCARFFNCKLLQQKQSFGLDESDFQSYLYDLLVTIGEKLFFSVITANPDASVGILFEGGNCRGRGLSNLENLKNKFAQIAQTLGDDYLAEEIDSTWSVIHTKLMKANMSSASDENKFLHTLWQSTQSHVVPPESKTYSDISECFDMNKFSRKVLLDRVSHFLAELSVGVILFCALHTCHHKGSSSEECFIDTNSKTMRDAFVRCCRDLHDLGAMDAFCSLLMCCYIYIPASQFLEVLISCEKYAMLVFRVSGKKSNTGKKELCKISGGVYLSKGENYPVVRFLEILTAKQVTEDCLEKFLYGTQDFTQWKYTHYFLVKCEQYLRYRKENPNGKIPTRRDLLLADENQIWKGLDHTSLTLEHILPQSYNPGDYWDTRFGEERLMYLNRIGNLSLAERSHNASYSCKSYNSKSLLGKHSYNTSKILLERHLAQFYVDWGPKQVIDREATLLEYAEDLWPLLL